MTKIEKMGNLPALYIPVNRLMVLPLILLTICIICRPANANTSIYVFDPNQSTVIQTGGFAGVNETYGIEGRFQLTVDFETGIAAFDMVDANITEPSGFLYTQSLGELFNMPALAGTVIDDTTIEFEGKTADGTESDVRLKLSLRDGSAHLTGNTTPPNNTADLFFYDVNSVATRKYAGGTGEPNDPYQIATAADLIALGKTPEDYDKNFILTTDIDLDPNLPGRKIFDRAVIAPDTNDVITWFEGTAFGGVFDGNGHTILHLTIIGSSWLGLFGQLDSEATITNLGLEVIDVNGTGSIVGGLVGFNSGSIVMSYVTGLVSGIEVVGGLVGQHNEGKITASYSTGMVTGVYAVGGLLGYNDDGSVTLSYSTNSVSGYSRVGGLVGDNGGIVTNSYSNGVVIGNEDVGGLIGLVVGGNPDSVSRSFWDIETSGQTTSDGGIGLTTTEMQTASTFHEAGWDFVGETENGTDNIWNICEGTNYPRFVWQIPAGDFICPDGVTIDDFSFFLEHWLDDNCDSSNGYCDGTDLDQSGTVGVIDLEIFFENWPAED
jgi:hypothetical protein